MSNHIEITVADHEAYVAAVAERDTLRKRVAELEAEAAKANEGCDRLAEALEAVCALVRPMKDRIEALEEGRDAAPLRIVLDQGPPTEAGWYVAEQEPDGRRQLAWFGHPHPRLRELFLRFSRRLDIVVPESEVGE